jgi:hypothetical protein
LIAAEVRKRLGTENLVCNMQLLCLLGERDAIILGKLIDWLKHEQYGKVFDGRRWIYNTYAAWQKQFKWITSIDSVRVVFDRLREKGLVLSSNQFREESNCGLWWSVDFEALYHLLSNDTTDLTPPELTTRPEGAAEGAGKITRPTPSGAIRARAFTRGAGNFTRPGRALLPGGPDGSTSPDGKSAREHNKEAVFNSVETTVTTAAAEGRAAQGVTNDGAHDTAAAVVASQGEMQRPALDFSPPDLPPADSPIPPENSNSSPRPQGDGLSAPPSEAAQALIAATFEPSDAAELVKETEASIDDVRAALAHAGRLRDRGELHGTFRGCVVNRLRHRYPAQPTRGNPLGRPASSQPPATPSVLPPSRSAADVEVLSLERFSDERIGQVLAELVESAPEGPVRVMWARATVAEIREPRKWGMLRTEVLNRLRQPATAREFSDVT